MKNRAAGLLEGGCRSCHITYSCLLAERQRLQSQHAGTHLGLVPGVKLAAPLRTERACRVRYGMCGRRGRPACCPGGVGTGELGLASDGGSSAVRWVAVLQDAMLDPR